MTHPVIMDHDLAVVAALAADTALNRPVGYVDAPAGALTNLLAGEPGYIIVYPLPGGWRDGVAVDPYADIELVYQMTCVDRLPQAAQWMADRIEAALTALTVTGRTVLWVTPVAPVGVTRDDSLAGEPLYIATPRYRIATTPT